MLSAMSVTPTAIFKAGVVSASLVGVAYTVFRKANRVVTHTRKRRLSTAFLETAGSTGHRPMVVVGPSGVGKGTLLKMLCDEFPGAFRTCTSHTTRKPREGEVDTVHYNFTTKEQMKKDIGSGKFIEYAEVHGNFYGTSIDAVKKVGDEGSICILEIDVQGADQIRKTALNAHYLFILPPSVSELEKRLTGRGSETEETVKRRLETARNELKFIEKCEYASNKIVNDSLDEAYQKLRQVVMGFYTDL